MRIEEDYCHKENEFKNIMKFLEEKTEYLFKLKKQYNNFYKKLNNNF